MSRAFADIMNDYFSPAQIAALAIVQQKIDSGEVHGSAIFSAIFSVLDIKDPEIPPLEEVEK